jgi:ribulose-phosphate 3-epimerase
MKLIVCKNYEDMSAAAAEIVADVMKANPACVLQVDGGVDEGTCDLCKENGAEILVAGSAYFKASDRAAFVKKIQA